MARKESLDIGYLNDIFENKDGIYSKDALLLQDILKYGISKERSLNFKFTDMAKWLMNNNREFHDYYAGSHDTMTNRIAKRRQRIQAALNKLQNLRLVVQTGSIKAERNNLETPTYDLTRNGYFSAALVSINASKHLKKDELQLMYDVFYGVLESLLTATISENSDTKSIVIKKIFQKIKEKSLIHEFGVEVLNTLHSNERDQMLETVEEILTLLDFPYGLRKLGRTSFLDLWKESVNELESDRKAALLFSYKLRIETQWSVAGTLNQEKTRMANASNFSSAIVDVDCWKCKIRTSCPVSVVELLECVFERRVKEGTQLLTGYQVSCPRCGGDDVFTWILMPKKEPQIIHVTPNWWHFPIENDNEEPILSRLRGTWGQ